MTNESTQGKLNKKHSVPQVLYTDGHESWMVWETIPSESEDKKGSKGYAMFWSLLGRENLGNYQLSRKDTLQDRLLLAVEECWSRIILEMQRGDYALGRGTK